MSGLARAVTWTQRIGYSYPPDIFQAAVKATFPRLTDTEVVHCVHEHQRVTAAWIVRVSEGEIYDPLTEARERV